MRQEILPAYWRVEAQMTAPVLLLILLVALVFLLVAVWIYKMLNDDDDEFWR